MSIVKFILLLGIFCTSTIIGIVISKRYSNRVLILKELKKALNIFEIKISYSLETIPDIFSDISIKMGGVVGKIFSDTVKNMNTKNIVAGEAWEKSIDLNCAELKEEDINSLKTLGKLLGSTDIEGQINQIRLVTEFINNQINDAEKEKNSNAKMYRKLGAILGLIIVIALI